jgi:hypothetical protein
MQDFFNLTVEIGYTHLAVLFTLWAVQPAADNLIIHPHSCGLLPHTLRPCKR